MKNKKSFYATINEFCQKARADLEAKLSDSDQEKLYKTVDQRIEYIAELINENFDVRRGNFTEWENHSINTVQTLMIFDTELQVWRFYREFSSNFCYAAKISSNFNANAKHLADVIDAQKGCDPEKIYVPEAYRGTRYQLFMNGIYDLKENKMIEPTEDTVLEYKGKKVPIQEIGFTFKHLHRVNFPTQTPDAPIHKGKKKGGGDWDFRQWLSLVCGNDEEKITWLLGIIGLSILPNTNIGVNIMLKGESGSGKTVIGDLIETIYCGYDPKIKNYFKLDDVAIVSGTETADTFNDDLPFRSTLTPTVNFAHVREMNGTDIYEKGSILYDKFGDDSMDIKVVHKQSNILSPTPTLYMEGTDWARFTTVKNGVQRRTLPFQLTKSEELTNYVVEDMKKADVFANEKVMNWLIYHAYQALRFLFKEDVSNLQINLNTFKLPKFMETYMQEIMSGGGEMGAFYDVLSKSLIVDEDDRYISIPMLHYIFKRFEYARGYQNVKGLNSFTEAIESLFALHDIQLVYYQTTRITERKHIALDFDELKTWINVSEELGESQYAGSSYAMFKDKWYKLKNIKQVENIGTDFSL